MWRELTYALDGFFGAGTKEEILAVQEWHEHLRVLDIGIKTVAVQFQVANNLRSQQADNIGAG